MNYKKFFSKANENHIVPFELKYHVASKLSLHVYNGEIEEYKIANDATCSGRGIYENKIGSFFSDRTDSKVADMMMKAIQENAKYGHEGNPDFFITIGKKYKRVTTYSKEIEDVKPEELMEIGKAISNEIRLKEPRITVSEVYLSKSVSHTEHYNSNGLKLKGKASLLTVFASVKIENGEEVESYEDGTFIESLDTFHKNAFVDDIIKNTVSKLGGQSVPSGKYHVIFDRKIVPMLLSPLLDQLSSYSVSQHLSLFEGKLNQKVLSNKLSIKENPWTKNFFGSSFDSEGMPTMKKDLISKGVLKTFLYDLDMAKKENKVSTGNGSNMGGNIHPGIGFVEVKKSSRSFQDLCSLVGNGIYITDLEGIGTGLNAQSGDYSLQAGGYLIENGKITKPITLITVAGNLLKDFNKVIAVGGDSLVTLDGMETPSIAIRNLAISGK